MSTRNDDVNRVIISGNLVDKPEIIEGESHSAFAKARLASNKSWRKGDEWHNSAVFNTIVFNNGLVNIASSLERGDKVTIVGETKNRKWKDDKGNMRSVVEIKVLELHVLKPKKAAEANPTSETKTEAVAE